MARPLLSPYRAVFSISFKNSFAYRSSVLTGIIGSLFSVFAQIAIWTFVFQHDTAMISYMTRYVIIAQLLFALLGNNVTARIGDRVYRGDFAVDLIKPVNSIAASWSASFGETLAGILTQALPVLVVFSPVFFGAGLMLSRLPIFIAILVFSLVLASEMYILLAYLSFVVLEVWPFVRLLNDTIRLLAGGFIPLAFFPGFLRKIADALPFQYLYSFPVRALLEEIPAREIASSLLVMGGWIAALGILVWVASRLAVRKIVVQGG